jgi:subtilase family serine protease
MVTVPVTVRDLPDVVVLPTDITVAPEHVRAEADATVHVQVRNQGGEDAENVEVVLTVGGIVVGTKEIPLIEPYSAASVGFEWTFEEGNVTVVASARPQGPVVEKSTANNQADVTLQVRSEERSDVSWRAFALVMGTLGTFFALILVAMAVRPGDRSRKG